MKPIVSWLWEAFSVLCLSVMGGVLNHMRGSNSGGVLTSDAFTGSSEVGYWIGHVYMRLLMALPTAALVQILARNSRLSFIFAFATFASIFIGWGSYMALGTDETGYNSRSGFLDWLVGRQLEGWAFSRRYIRDYAGMGMRGLMWTLPAGQILHRCGYGWQFSLSGAMMPVMYSIGFWKHTIWTADGWKPASCPDGSVSQDWAFSTGTPMSEFLFGTWFWLCLLVALLRRQPTRAQVARSRMPLWYEIVCWINVVLFVASSCWYASVKQRDTKNWGQTLVGCVVSSLVLLVSLIAYRRKLRKSGRQVLSIQSSFGYSSAKRDSADVDGTQYHILGATSAEEDSDDDASDSDSDISQYDADELPWGVIGRPGREQSVFKWLERALGVLSVLSLVATLAFCIVCLGWNWSTPRYCTAAHAPKCQ
eukprot:m.53694 g.53694  ORF g.53694 m.53694 type:complete len:422 (+) comp12818_c0_seq2:152-1417(+)